MDEPLSNLDAKLRVTMRAEIAALHQRLGVTTIYVTHDQIEAMTMANRIVIMNNGLVQQIADPDTMFRKPANLFVAGFIGSPGMNFLRTSRHADGRFAVLGEMLALKVPESVDDVIVGLRPEHIEPGKGGLTFEIRPTLVEGLGSESYVYFDVPEVNHLAAAGGATDDGRPPGRIVARLMNAGPVRVGETLTVSVDPDRLHLFDPATGQAIPKEADRSW